MSKKIRLLDFNVYNKDIINQNDSDSEDNGKYKKITDKKEFIIQMFGLDKKGKTYSIIVNDFQPFFYIKVSNNWKKTSKIAFLEYLKEKIGSYYEDSICDCKLVEKKTLYGFDNNKKHRFIYLKFKNTAAMNKVKNLFYENGTNEEGEQTWVVSDKGLKFNNTKLQLYESNIPPILRFFHMKNISPSGWISINNRNCIIEKLNKTTHCNYEIIVDSYKYITSWDSEDKVPYKICSFDIEASSSHGDFPLATKTYNKLVTNIIEYWEQILEDEYGTCTYEEYENILRVLIESAFGYISNDYIDKIYIDNPHRYKEKVIKKKILKIINYRKNQRKSKSWKNNDKFFGGKDEQKTIFKISVIDILNNNNLKREIKVNMITRIFDDHLPKIQGDKVTFIGSTFLKYGDKSPYLNHCIALNTCDKVDGVQIEQYDNEKDVLLAWCKLIREENPDIIIGYNIFGFDYKFMFERIKTYGIETVEEFLKMSRNKDEICGKFDSDNGEYNINKSVLKIASGEHNLEFIKMNGRIHIDLYNYFRRDYNLESYKLDFVSGHFICDVIKNVNKDNDMNCTTLSSKNIVGLKIGDFIKIEEIGHSSDFYNEGKKYQVIDLNNGDITINGLVNPDETKKLKWCLAKDDVSPFDIFRMTNEGPKERAIIAKYCIQDCNLVHHLMNKIDILTGFIEMANICSVPIDFIVMRGQGIKLFSFVAKKCREDGTVIPVLKKKNDGGYEGAIVLDPKCGLYLEEPVACVDYSSLYPSSMISENLSHDSKVWTKEYNLDGELINETGIKDKSGNFIYDNLENHKYVNIEYDTFNYIRKTPKSKAVKTLSGKKLCRFVQLPENKLSIMPRILKELLFARKSTRASAKWKTVETNIGNYTGLIIDETETHLTIKDKDNNIKIIERISIKNIKNTYNDFMKNVLDKRQLAIKVTANSLYGQCGARTSCFYEKDVAASTTATGRKLLTYGKRIIEEVYGDRICTTKYGTVKSNAEYIYGDSVTGDTPIILRNRKNGKILSRRISDICNEWKEYDNFKPFDTYISNRIEKQQGIILNHDVWSKNGWSNIKRVIRHKCDKKIYRVTTLNSVVDVTEDHSLLDKNGYKIKPEKCNIGTELLEKKVFEFEPSQIVENDIEIKCNTKLEASSMQLIYMKKGYNIIMKNYKENNEDIYILTCSKNYSNYKDNSNSIKEIYIKYNEYSDFVYDIETEDGTFNTGFPLIIKNTDSVFMSFKLTDPDTGNKIVGHDALKHTIELAKEAGELATSFLKEPHDLEYEKTFMPFCLLSKKRYVGMLYEEDPNKCYRKSMGIVLKRRDNAPIVKDVYGGIIDILMKNNNVSEAIKYTKKCMDDIINEKYPLEKLIITKSLRSNYKNPLQIAHKVLADRIAKRDPGNRPTSGDRIPYVFIQTKQKVKLQGDRIENPDFVRKNNLKPDYVHYITNQIMKPVQQVFALVIEKIPEYEKNLRKFNREINKIKRKYKDNPAKQMDYEQKYRNSEVKELIFSESLRKSTNINNSQTSIISFFK